MNQDLLRKHVREWLADLKTDPEEHQEALDERKERVTYFSGWTRPRMLKMDEDQLYEYIAKLWAMRMWGNKHYVVDTLIKRHGLAEVREHLAELVWGSGTVAQRWDKFRGGIKGIGPAMMSEILCSTHPDKCAIWNRRALVALDYLGVTELPQYDYQLTGVKYTQISATMGKIVAEIREAGISDANYLTADYFIWDVSEVTADLGDHASKPALQDAPASLEKVSNVTSEFIHDEIRDKLAEIGRWLGFQTDVEIKVAAGSKVDAVWEATIGNLGRVIYVFEVQTKGSIDSLMMNLLKALNNPAVQGVVAVSDGAQLEKIKSHAAGVKDLNTKLKYWDYKEVLLVHEQLKSVNEAINQLGLVPEGF